MKANTNNYTAFKIGSIFLQLCICFCVPVLTPSLFVRFFSTYNFFGKIVPQVLKQVANLSCFFLFWIDEISFSLSIHFSGKKKSENWFREQEHKETKNIKNKTGQDPLYDWHMVVHFGLKRMINCYIYPTNFISSFHQPFLLCKKGKFLFSNWLNSIGHLNS